MPGTADPLPRPPVAQRCRIAFIAGREDDARARLGRPLTADELRRALLRYPGDRAAARAELERRWRERRGAG